MKITRYAIRYRPVVYLLIVLVVLAGISAYRALPRESSPDIKVPVVLVSAAYPGVSPKDIEALVVHPLERELKELRDVKEMRSTATEGAGVVTLEFEPDVDIDTVMQRIRDKVDRARPDLPKDAEDPVINEISTEAFPVMLVALTGDYGLVRLKEVAKDLKDAIELIPGVLDVTLSGGVEREVQVRVDPARLAQYRLTMDDVAQAVGRENVNLPGGVVDVGRASYLVRIPAEIEDPSVIPDLVVKVKDGEPIYVRDLAEVVDGHKERGTYARVDGHEAVSLAVTKRSGANLVALADGVRRLVDEKEPGWPMGTKVVVLNDRSKDVRDVIRQLENNMVTALVLVVAVLLFALGLRNSLFVATAIPLSMLITFVALQAAGITLNMIVLFSLILAVGMLVDNAIVIVENIYRHMQQGKPRVRAAYDGTVEVAWPVITSTLTTVAAFVPLLFWPGITGEFMHYLPLTVIISLLASLFVALVMNPVLCATFMTVDPSQRHEDEDTVPESRLTRAYRRALEWALHRPDIVSRRGLRHGVAPLAGVVVMALAAFPAQGLLGRAGLAAAAAVGLATFVGVWLLVMRDNRYRVVFGMLHLLLATALVYAAFDHGVEFFPPSTPDAARVSLSTADGSNLDATDRAARGLEGFLAGQGNVAHYASSVGGAAGSMNVGQSSSNRARVSVDFLPEGSRVESSYATVDRIRDAAKALPGVEVELATPQNGPSGGSPVELELRGDDFDTLGRIARRVRDRIADVPGLVDLTDDYQSSRPELRVTVDRTKARLAGVSTYAVASTVRSAIYGQKASVLRDGTDEYDVVVRLPKTLREDPTILGRLTVPDADGAPVPLTQVASVDTAGGTGSIRHKDGRQVITVSANVQGRLANDVLKDVRARLSDLSLPAGYGLTYAGENEESDEASSFLSQAFVISLFLIFMILVAQFNSVVVPGIILISVALSLVGVLFGLTVTAQPFGIVMTGLGVISLAGIVVNNAIVLIDFIRQLRERGHSRRDAIVRAGTIRLRPVLLTAVTTLLGLLPMALKVSVDFFTPTVQVGGSSADLWNPMAVAVVSGLTVSTFLTLVVVPVLYSLFDDVSDWGRRVARRGRRLAEDDHRAMERAA